jgi:decaprenyl-phosphate phosphoribosyltransferase
VTEPDPAATLREPGSLPAELLREARPKQWAKNVLVFAAPAAAGVLDEWPAQWRAVVAFVAFSAAASGTYFLNDVADVKADRALTVTYSWWWKHVAVVDLVVVALGFVLRAIGGGAAVDVPISDWFLITTSFASLFVVAGKRHADLAALGLEAGETRSLLDTYTLPFLRMVLAVSLGATVVGYCLWAFETSRTATTSLPLYELSIIPMVTALLRYALLLDGGHGSAPEDVLLGDHPLQVLGVLWAVLFLGGVYLG